MSLLLQVRVMLSRRGTFRVAYPMPVTLQVLALMALRAGETIRAGHMAVLRANLVHAEAFFEEFEHMFEWQPPAAGSVAFPR